MTFNEMMIDDLLHKIEIQNQKIGEMQKEIERLHEVFDIKDERYSELVKENKELQRKFDDTTNGYKLASYEISVLNKYIDKLTSENNDLKHRRKLFVKQLLNTMYGFEYADTDSIKEGLQHDGNN